MAKSNFLTLYSSMKIKLFEHTFRFKTKRKTCPQCNGKTWNMTDEGTKDGCESCGRGGEFKAAFHSCIDGFGMGNLFFFKKYLSSKDFEIAEKINRNNNKKNREQGHITDFGLDCVGNKQFTEFQADNKIQVSAGKSTNNNPELKTKGENDE